MIWRARVLGVLAMISAICVAGGSARAGYITGVVFGPDDSTSINMSFTTGPGTERILAILIDGTSAVGFPLIWLSVDLDVGVIDGHHSELPSTSFVIAYFDWVRGERTLEVKNIQVAGNPGPSIVRVKDLIGVRVQAYFNDPDATVEPSDLDFVGWFADDPAPGAGLTLVPEAASAPEPATVALAATGALVLALFRWRAAAKRGQPSYRHSGGARTDQASEHQRGSRH